MSINYVNITPTVVAAADKKPGHSDILYLQRTSAFTAIAGALADGTPGATKRVTTDHTFPVNEGFLKIHCKAKSIDPTGDAQGEAGGQVPNYKYKVIIKGDSPTILEFVENILNEDLIAIFNGPVCGVDDFVQVGNECSPAQISGFAFRAGSRGNGGFKEYEFTIESSEKMFYEGTITEHVDASNILDGVGTIVASLVEDTSFVVTWTAVDDATGYEVDFGTSSSFAGATQDDITPPTVTDTLDSLTADTTYYVRIRAISSVTGIAAGPYSYITVKTDAA